MPGLKLNFIRVVGKALNLIAIILILVALFVVFGSELTITSLILTIGTILLIIQFYIEKDFMDKYRKFIILIVLVATIGIILFWILFVEEADDYEAIFYIVLIYIGPLSGVFYQQYSLSIYKKEKLGFLISFGIMMIGYIGWFNLTIELVLPIIALIFAIVGLILIIVAESILRKKKLLNYI